MLNSKNIYVSILEINGETIITTLNKLPYMSDCKHLKRRGVQMTWNHLRLSMGWQPPECLGTTNTLENKPAPQEDGFYPTLSKQLIHFLLINGMMSCICLNIELLEIMEQGGHDLSQRWWPWTILSTNVLEVMFLHWLKKWESIPTFKTEEDDEETVGL